MKQVYPVIFSPAPEGGYDVYVPDFPLNTQGGDMAEAIHMARDAIGGMGNYFEDEGKALPAPSDLAAVEAQDGDIVSLVDVDFTAYRRAHDKRSVRRNVTIPAWLDDEAKSAGINVSGVLQRALKEELHIEG